MTITVTAVTDHQLVVDTTSDVSDGDTSSIDALLDDRGADGFISLREAIVAANNTANYDSSTPDQTASSPSSVAMFASVAM